MARATNQRVYLFTSGLIRIQYGQDWYDNLTAAVAAIQSETFTEYSLIRDNAILIGIISVARSTTNLADNTQAHFTYVSKFGEQFGGTGGLSTTTLQQAYNNSSNPEIVINSTLDGLSIQNGTGNADNITNLIEGKNTATSTTSFIRADGLISGNTVSTVTLTVNGIQYIESVSATSINTTGVTISSIPTVSGSSAHFEYVVTNSSGYTRAGIVMCVWDNTSTTFNDVSTPDLNGSTLGFSWNVIVSGSNLILRANATSGTWTIKVGTRIIF